MNDDWVVRARVVAPHGLRGEVQVQLSTDYPERLAEEEVWKLRLRGGEVRDVPVTAIREHKGAWLVTFEGVEDRGGAELLRGAAIVAGEQDLPPLPDGEHYWHELIGLQVVTCDGRVVGTVKDILRTGSNDVYVTEGPMIPAINDVVEEIDPAAGRIVIRPMPGLLD